MKIPTTRLVTIGGECFDAAFDEVRSTLPHRDGTLHYLRLQDLIKDRGERRVSLYFCNLDRLSIPRFEQQLNTVALNVIRRGFDSGVLNFDSAHDAGTFKEIPLQLTDFDKQPARTDDEVRSYIIQKCYLLAYRHPVRSHSSEQFDPISFGDEADLEYLGIHLTDILRNIRRLSGQGFLTNVMDAYAGPTEQLLTYYESGEEDDHKFARRAIDQARKSASEPDGKPHPKVGAVVVKDGRILSEAHRGEILGNHAEYVAMELKLPDESLSGASVYTTLEPCTSRRHPKIPCADRLAERKIARVVIGMLDPDKRITGQGVQRLRKANITVAFFPSDLIPEVEELNREFTREREHQRRLEDEQNAVRDKLLEEQRQQIADLKRKPYEAILGNKAENLLAKLSPVGKRLMRHLVENEPLEVGRQFLRDVSGDEQFQQLTLAMDEGVIRHREVRVGSGALLRTDYEVNSQYRSVLQDLLYRDGPTEH